MTLLSNNKPLNKQLNKYAQWKYWVLVVTLIILFLSALPSWYGEDAALQLSSKKPTSLSSEQVYQVLNQAGIHTKRIDQQMQNTLVVLQQADQQTLAKNVLSQAFAEDVQVTLVLAPAAPNWLLNMGFAPIKLGLDLRGGVQFLLDVDLDLVFTNQALMVSDSVKQFVRQEHISAVMVRQGDGAEVNIEAA